MSSENPPGQEPPDNPIEEIEELLRKLNRSSKQEPNQISDAAERLEKLLVEKEKEDAIRKEKEKRYKERVDTVKWAVIVMVGLFGFGVTLIIAIMYQVHGFNRDLRIMGERITVIETERKPKKAEKQLICPPSHKVVPQIRER